MCPSFSDVLVFVSGVYRTKGLRAPVQCSVKRQIFCKNFARKSITALLSFDEGKRTKLFYDVIDKIDPMQRAEFVRKLGFQEHTLRERLNKDIPDWIAILNLWRLGAGGEVGRWSALSRTFARLRLNYIYFDSTSTMCWLRCQFTAAHGILKQHSNCCRLMFFPFRWKLSTHRESVFFSRAVILLRSLPMTRYFPMPQCWHMPRWIHMPRWRSLPIPLFVPLNRAILYSLPIVVQVDRMGDIADGLTVRSYPDASPKVLVVVVAMLVYDTSLRINCIFTDFMKFQSFEKNAHLLKLMRK